MTSILLKNLNNNGVCTLTLNRPDARNALSDAMLAELQAALDAVATDAAVRVVVIAANGPAFCAGHDLREVAQKQGLDDYRDLFNSCSDMMTAIVRLPKPVIAQVDGIATAAGCQLVASCDLAVATPAARFATPGVNIGLFCSTPMVALSRKVGRSTAMAMLLTGEPLDADAAMRAGLINKIVAADDLATETAAWAATIAAKSAATLAIGKEAFYRQAEMALSDAYAYAGEVMSQNMTKHDAQEGIAAFVEKRRPVWRDK